MGKAFNNCIEIASKACAYLAENVRPTNGEDGYNSLHLHQLSAELKKADADYVRLDHDKTRFEVAIRIAITELERHRDNNSLQRDGQNQVLYALHGLWECVGPPKPEDEERWTKKDPKLMTAQQLADNFADRYSIHSNPSIYNYLKAGYDEVLRRLRLLEE